jgi:hypothetical protein
MNKKDKAKNLVLIIVIVATGYYLGKYFGGEFYHLILK